MQPYNPAQNVMIDVETLGTKPGSVILSIGACTFDLNKTFYTRVSIQSSLNHGFSIDERARMWWKEQPAEVRDEAFSGKTSVIEALHQLTDFLELTKLGGDHLYVWGKGADFDVPMLNAYYDNMSMLRPWSHRDSRCFRTLSLFDKVNEPERLGDKHNALDDAKHQARWANQIMVQLAHISTAGLLIED